MKKSFAIIMVILMMVCTACSGKEAGTQLMPESEAQTSSQSIGEEVSAGEVNEADAENSQLEQETHDLLLSLYEPAVETFFWYRSDPTEDLQIVMDGEYVEDDYYRPVGRFATIEEMKTATEQFFTKDFCETIFYEPAFNQYAMYKEVDGKLYRNIQSGGMGWYFTLTDEYELAYADDQWRVLQVNIQTIEDNRSWYTFVFQKEGDAWKFHHFYDLSPLRDYEVAAAPLLSSPIAAFDWERISDLEPVYLASYYIYQFLSDVGNEYNDANPYVVPAAEVVENFSRHFDGITKEMFIEAAQNQSSSVEYDEAEDTFLFYITFDPGHPLVLRAEKSGDEIILQSLSIGKSGRAVRWSYLSVRETDDGLRYISNRVEDIPEN